MTDYAPAYQIAFPEPQRAEAPDPSYGGKGHAYVCRVCAWTGCGASAADHFARTGHAVRGKAWPLDWPDARFSVEGRS